MRDATDTSVAGTSNPPTEKGLELITVSAADLRHLVFRRWPASQVLSVFALPRTALVLASTHKFAQSALPGAVESDCLENPGE